MTIGHLRSLDHGTLDFWGRLNMAQSQSMYLFGVPQMWAKIWVYPPWGGSKGNMFFSAGGSGNRVNLVCLGFGD